VPFEVEEGDLPMLARALLIARNTAMMSGHGVAQSRLEDYIRTVGAAVHPTSKLFDEMAWSEIVMAVMGGADWSVQAEERNWRWISGREIAVTVSAGDRTWRSQRTDLPAGGSDVCDVRDLLRDMAPVGSRCLDDGADPAPAGPR
jgi:hypothetical protein